METNKDIRRGYNFNRIAIGIIRILFGWLICLVMNFRCKHYKPKNKTFMVLSNHTMNLDPIFDVILLRHFVRFVASSNIMRGFPGCFVKWLANPIPRRKGAPADDVIVNVKASLAAGIPVAMYPEGNVTWDGETGFISRRTAELVKESEGSLITLRKIGGCLKFPRWAMVKRSGPIYGEVVNEYSREELNNMTVDEILEVIRKDLYVDAYKEQETRHWKYRCSALAKGLEASLYVCPVCGKVGELSSDKDRFFCECTASWTYDVEGYLHPEKNGENEAKIPVHTFSDEEKISVLEWSRWQKAYLRDNAEGLKACVDEPICVDDGIMVYGDRLEIPNAIIQNGPKEEGLERSVYYWSDIQKLSLFRDTRLFFTWKDQVVEVHVNPHVENIGIRYYALWRICTGREYL